MTSKLRLLDLALSYALDTPAIHMNDPGNISSLREMQTQVLKTCMTDGTSVTLGSDDVALPLGLCGNRDDHSPHAENSPSLGKFWCTADQSTRLPFAAERRRSASAA